MGRLLLLQQTLQYNCLSSWNILFSELTKFQAADPNPNLKGSELQVKGRTLIILKGYTTMHRQIADKSNTHSVSYSFRGGGST